jgi:hypothetical protein
MLHSSMHSYRPEPSGVPSPFWQVPSRGPLPRLGACILWVCLLLCALPSAARAEVRILHLQGVDSTVCTGRRTRYLPIDLGSRVARVNSASVRIAGTHTGGQIMQDCGSGAYSIYCPAIINVDFPPYDDLAVQDCSAGGPHAMLWPFGNVPLVADSANAWECLADGVSTLLVRVESCWTPPFIWCSYESATPSTVSITEAYLTIDFDALVPTEEESWGRIKGRYR